VGIADYQPVYRLIQNETRNSISLRGSFIVVSIRACQASYDIFTVRRFFTNSAYDNLAQLHEFNGTTTTIRETHQARGAADETIQRSGMET